MYIFALIVSERTGYKISQ